MDQEKTHVPHNSVRARTIITDIFNNKLNKTDNNDFIPFIILHSSYPNDLIIRTFKDEFSIYRLNYTGIDNTLYLNGINSKNYGPVGSLWFNDIQANGYPKHVSVLLANINSSISIYPTDYKLISDYGTLTIWEPIGPPNYKAISLIASKNKPDITSYRIINTKYITKYNGPIQNVQEFRNMNEYDLLGLSNIDSFTINKSIFLKNKKLFNINNSDSQSHDSTESNWNIQSGKKVVLIESDDPWYIRKRAQHPILISKIINNNKPVLPDADRYPTYKNADYKSDFMLDVKSKSLGYGNSYKERLGQPCACGQFDNHTSPCTNCNKNITNDKCDSQENVNKLPPVWLFEGFIASSKDKINKNMNMLVSVLLTIVILLIVGKYYFKQK